MVGLDDGKVGEIVLFIHSRNIFRVPVIEYSGRWGYNDDKVSIVKEFTV